RLRPGFAAEGLLHRMAARAGRALGERLSQPRAFAGRSRGTRRARVPAMVRSDRAAAAHQGARDFLAPGVSRRESRVSERAASDTRVRARHERALSRARELRPHAPAANRPRALPCKRARGRAGEMKAMVLAAGRGERLRPITDTTPKPLVLVAGKPLIAYHLEALERAGIRDVVINLSWLADKVRAALRDGSEYGVRITYTAEGPVALGNGRG